MKFFRENMTQKEMVRYAILVLAIAVCFALYFMKYYENKELDSMERLYIHIANAMGDSDYSTDGRSAIELITWFSIPFYSAIIFLVQSVFSTAVTPMIILQVIVTAISVIYLYWIMKRYANGWISLAFSVCYMMYYPLMKYSFSILMESFSASLVIFFAYNILRYASDKTRRNLAWSIVWMILLILLNNRFIFHGFVAFFVILIYLFKNDRASLKTCWIGLAAFLAILIPWEILVISVYKAPVFISPHKSRFLTQDLKGLEGSEEDENFVGLERLEILSYEGYRENLKSRSSFGNRRDIALKQLTPEYFEKIVTRHRKEGSGIRKYMSRLLTFFRLYRTKVNFATGTDHRLNIPTSKAYNLSQIALLLPFMLLSIIGTIRIFKKKDFGLFMLLVFMLSHIAIHVYTHVMARYRVPVVPIFYIIGIFGFTPIVDYLTNFFTKERSKA